MGNAAELLFRLNDPKRRERDKERESGRSRCEVFDGEDESFAFRSSSVVTNLSNNANSASLFDVRFTSVLLEDAEPAEPAVVGMGSTSES